LVNSQHVKDVLRGVTDSAVNTITTPAHFIPVVFAISVPSLVLTHYNISCVLSFVTAQVRVFSIYTTGPVLAGSFLRSTESFRTCMRLLDCG
jgi:hypothetical protein